MLAKALGAVQMNPPPISGLRVVSIPCFINITRQSPALHGSPGPAPALESQSLRMFLSSRDPQRLPSPHTCPSVSVLPHPLTVISATITRTRHCLSQAQDTPLV